MPPRLPPLRSLRRPPPSNLRQCRQFHVSRPQNSAFLETTTHLLTTLQHTSGLPWYAFIPLSAITLRFAITTPLTLYARNAIHTRLTLQPLIPAWSRTIARNLQRSKLLPREWEKASRKVEQQNRREIYKRHSAQTWKLFMPVLQVPVWVVASMTLRNVTGLQALPTWLGGTLPEHVPDVGLQSGGLGPWLDLTQMDPTLILPGVFCLAIFANIQVQAKYAVPKTRLQKGLRNSMLVFTACMFPLAVNVPAAVTLYWAVSASFSLVQNVVLQWVWPYPKLVQPCKHKDAGMAFEPEK